MQSLTGYEFANLERDLVMPPRHNMHPVNQRELTLTEHMLNERELALTDNMLTERELDLMSEGHESDERELKSHRWVWGGFRRIGSITYRKRTLLRWNGKRWLKVRSMWVVWRRQERNLEEELQFAQI